MDDRRSEPWSRREFLGGLTLAGTAGLLGVQPGAAAADPAPETAKLRLTYTQPPDAPCLAPEFFAEELLHREGFTDVQYIKTSAVDIAKSLTRTTDMTMHTPGPLIMAVDAGEPIVMLGGVHVGCFELFGTDRVRSIRDLKGKSVAAGPLGSGRQVFMASMLAYVGVDPRKNVNWITDRPAVAMRLLAEGKIDAFMSFPPEPQELRSKKIGHVLVNTMMDRPWSQYFCCKISSAVVSLRSRRRMI